MTTAETVLQLYQTSCPTSLFEAIQPARACVYTPRVVVGLMILQWMQGNATQAAAVEQLHTGAGQALLSPCKQVRENRVSSNTGAYCQARQRLCKVALEQVNQRTIEQLREELKPGWPGLPPVFVLDGSTLQLQHERQLLKAYPPGRNQHGQSHWPVLQILVAHDTYTGLAWEPACGPMYGAHAVSEQKLAEQVLERLPQGSVLLADRNFGTWATVHTAHRQGHPVIVRLNTALARRLAGRRKLRAGEEQVLEWRPSAWDRRHHPQLPSEALVRGRLLVVGLAGMRERLYLFTTLEVPATEVAKLYVLRWHIETDLRALKQTIRLERLSGKSLDIVEKELWAAIITYNLVRAVMCLAAKRAGITPRDLSFTRALGLLTVFLPRLADQQPVELQDAAMDELIRHVASCKLPKRKRRRSFPRAVWAPGYRFPRRKPEKIK